MGIWKKAVTGISAAAVAAASLAVPASAAEKYRVAFRLDRFSGNELLEVFVESGYTVSSELYQSAYNGCAGSIIYPEPVNGKGIRGWAASENGTEPVNLNAAVSEDAVLYPIIADAVELGTVAVNVDPAYLPKTGESLHTDMTAYVSVPADAPYVIDRAYYTGFSLPAAFAADSEYTLCVDIHPAEGKVFDYTYSADGSISYKADGAAVNGEKAALQWDSDRLRNDIIHVYYTVSTGSPETVQVNFHFNGHGNAADHTVTVPKGTENLYNYLDNAAGELLPADDAYYFDGWYSDAAMTEKTIPFRVPDGDIDFYAKWDRLITEINFTIETPLCGTVVENVGTNQEITADDLRTTVEGADEPMPGRVPGAVVLTNEPEITCDVPGVTASPYWITSDAAPDTMTPDTEIAFFMGTIWGENDYMFIISCERGEDADYYFAENLKVTVNGTAAPESLGSMQYTANVMQKPSTKGGKVSKAATVNKRGNSFSVVGVITADHNWDDGVITKAPDCEEDGTKTYTCKSKDATYNEEVDAYGHKWLQWTVVKAATATEDGLEKRICSNKGEHYETRVIPKGTPGGSNTPQPGGPKTGDHGAGAAVPIAAAAGLLALASACIRRRQSQ